MTNYKILILIGVLAWIIFWPKINVDNAENIIYSDDTYIDYQEESIVDNELQLPEDNINRTNACNSSNYGYPNFSGTNLAGKVCSDILPIEAADQICIAMPPDNYDGIIDIASSDPPLTCCMQDGSCQW